MGAARRWAVSLSASSASPIIVFVGWRLGQPGQGLGLLGGGYGAVQVAITGADWLPLGWTGAALLLFLCLAKICRPR